MHFKKNANKCADKVIGLLHGFSLILFLMCVSVVFINIILRYFFKHPLSWADEMATISMVLMVLLAVVEIEKEDKHLQISILQNFFGDRVKLVLKYIKTILATGIAVYLTVIGSKTAYLNYKLGYTTVALKVPTAAIYAVIPTTFLVIAIISILTLIDLLSTKGGKTYGDA